MESKEVLYYNIGDFCVEAEWEDEETVGFWLSRKNYGIKEYMFGIPKHKVPEGKIENVFAEYIFLFCDRGYMNVYISSLLEDGETVDEYFIVHYA